MAEARSIDARELSRWRSSGRAHTLLDVRRDDEVRAAAMPDALHVPMREVPGRLASIPRDRPIVVVCHHGERSAFVAELLARYGFEDVFNLAGGIDAYASVDPSIPRY